MQDKEVVLTSVRSIIAEQLGADVEKVGLAGAANAPTWR
jgi:hypothetical protein